MLCIAREQETATASKLVTPARLCFEHTQRREDEEVAVIVGVYRIRT
jgi:hypothetical protein